MFISWNLPTHWGTFLAYPGKTIREHDSVSEGIIAFMVTIKPIPVVQIWERRAQQDGQIPLGLGPFIPFMLSLEDFSIAKG